MARHLDPFSQAVLALRRSNKATEPDRKAAIKFLLEIRRTTTLNTGQASIVCRGVMATIEALATEALLLTVEPGSGRHKNLVLIHAKHLDEMNKSFALLSKHMEGKTRGSRHAAKQKGSPLWPPRETVHADHPGDPEPAAP